MTKSNGQAKPDPALAGTRIAAAAARVAQGNIHSSYEQQIAEQAVVIARLKAAVLTANKTISALRDALNKADEPELKLDEGDQDHGETVDTKGA